MFYVARLNSMPTMREFGGIVRIPLAVTGEDDPHFRVGGVII